MVPARRPGASSPRPSLFLRLTSLFAVAIALPLAGSGWFLLRGAGQRIEAEAARREAALADFGENLLVSTIERAEVKLATLARMLERARLAPQQSELLEAQVEPPDVFLELQSFGTEAEVAVQSQVTQRLLPDAAPDPGRALANRLSVAVQTPLATRLPWRAGEFEHWSGAATLAVSAPTVVEGDVVGVLVGYIDFGSLRASLARAAAECRIVVRDRAGTVLAEAGADVADPRSFERGIAGTPWRIEVLESREVVAAPLAELRRRLLPWAALGLALALGAGALLAARIARPIARLESAAKRMAAGDLTARSAVEGDDELGRLGRAFDTMAAEFERLDAAKSAFVGNVSHELRTPLTALRLSVENLLQGVRGPLGDGQRATLERVERDLRRLSALVDDLLELARLESGAAPARCEAQDLRPIAEGAVEPWRAVAAARGVRIALDGEGRARVDPALLARALSNLVDNAVKFSPDGGLVEVVLRGSVLEVRDAGPGVGGERVFERFVQGEQHGAKSSGVGIGLSIVRRALRMMDGDAEVRGRDDGRPGAVFVVRLRAE